MPKLTVVDAAVDTGLSARGVVCHLPAAAVRMVRIDGPLPDVRARQPHDLERAGILNPVARPLVDPDLARDGYEPLDHNERLNHRRAREAQHYAAVR